MAGCLRQLEMLGSTKIPPAWDPASEAEYPFHTWVEDVRLWSCATELQVQQRAPAVVMRLSGVARIVARELPSVQLQHGAMIDRNDGNGPQGVDGLTFLVSVLQQHFAPLAEETTLKAVSDFLGFRAESYETVDKVIARFNMSRAKAQSTSGFAMSSQGYAWMLLGALGCEAKQWSECLQPFGGVLPSNEQQLLAMMAQLRRMGHLLEGHHMAINRSTPTAQPSYFFPAWSNQPQGGFAL